jgi:hypothetical protein
MLGFGALWAGGFDRTAWVSVISAAVVIALVTFMSATRGHFWEN